jgi:hypothetical protein
MTYEKSRLLLYTTIQNQTNWVRQSIRIVHAQEAPVIITATAKEDFKPDKADSIGVTIKFT